MLNLHYRNFIPFIVQIGTGGTGGYVCQHLAQMLGTSGKEHYYVLVDPDRVEKKNLKNQLFLEEEIGLKKADVLADRYSEAFDLNIWSYTDEYIDTPDKIAKLFNPDFISSGSQNILPILIANVDNNYSRAVMDQFFKKVNKIVYIDAGNESVSMPQDWQTREQREWTVEEKEIYKNSGYSGQIVVGLKLGKDYLPPVAEMYPDILEDKDDFINPNEVSCTEITASEPQRIITNKFAALAVANIVQELLEENTITNHQIFFHAKKAYMRGVPYVNDLDGLE